MTGVVDELALLTDDEIEETSDTIARTQQRSGMIPWTTDQRCDPWNHTEAAMALTIGRRLGCARRAYEWLGRSQRYDGSWCASYYPDGRVMDARVDTNTTAYVATGVLHYVISLDDLDFARRFYPVVEKAIEFVLSHQMRSGAISWSVESDGRPSVASLISASSSIYQSLSAAVELGTKVGIDRSDWRAGAERLRGALTGTVAEFLNKDEYAMDWYYPVLTGVVTGKDAAERLRQRESTFVVPERGVLCRSDRRWVTTAETAELAIALVRTDHHHEAQAMLELTRAARDDEGSYATGIVYPEAIEFPAGERTSYSSAAVLLANDVLGGGRGSKAVFSLVGTDGAAEEPAMRRWPIGLLEESA